MRLLFDDEQWFDLAENIHPNDVLGFKDSKSYKYRLKQAKQKLVNLKHCWLEKVR